MDLYYLVLTSASVSIDSLAAGAALGARAGGTQRTALVMMAAVTIMCLAAALMGLVPDKNLPPVSEKIGGVILITVGLWGALSAFADRFKGDNVRKRPLMPAPAVCKRPFAPAFDGRKDAGGGLVSALATGIAIGLDGAAACLSLTLMGYGMYAAAAVIIFHYVFIETGILLSSRKIFSALGQSGASSVILITLGIMKLT